MPDEQPQPSTPGKSLVDRVCDGFTNVWNGFSDFVNITYEGFTSSIDYCSAVYGHFVNKELDNLGYESAKNIQARDNAWYNVIGSTLGVATGFSTMLYMGAALAGPIGFVLAPLLIPLGFAGGQYAYKKYCTAPPKEEKKELSKEEQLQQMIQQAQGA